jgi:hypothetical protein
MPNMRWAKLGIGLFHEGQNYARCKSGPLVSPWAGGIWPPPHFSKITGADRPEYGVQGYLKVPDHPIPGMGASQSAFSSQLRLTTYLKSLPKRSAVELALPLLEDVPHRL